MKNVLIIKIGAIGDIIMALPTLTAIKEDYPGSKITWVCGSIVEPILKCIPDIDKTISINEKKLFNKKKINAVKELLAYYKKNVLESYDLVINFHHDRRYSALHTLIRKKDLRVLTRDGDRPKLIPARSRAFEHLRLYKDFDHEYNAYLRFPKYALPDFNLNELIDFDPEKRIVTIAPGGANNVLNEQALRRWPIVNYRKIVEYLNSINVTVLISGAPSDSWVIDEMAGLKFTNLVGKLTIVELIWLFKKSDIVLTHDSGPFHLAVFANKPKVLGLFGPTNPREFNYQVRNNNVSIIWGGEGLQCSPCYFGKNFSLGCKNNICMEQIQPQMVINEMEKLL